MNDDSAAVDLDEVDPDGRLRLAILRCLREIVSATRGPSEALRAAHALVTAQIEFTRIVVGATDADTEDRMKTSLVLIEAAGRGQLLGALLGTDQSFLHDMGKAVLGVVDEREARP